MGGGGDHGPHSKQDMLATGDLGLSRLAPLPLLLLPLTLTASLPSPLPPLRPLAARWPAPARWPARARWRVHPRWPAPARVVARDLDPAVEGDEALVGGFSDALTLLRFHGDGQVTSEEIGRTPAAAKGMVPHGDGVAVACRDGSLLVVRPSDEGFVTEVLFRAPSGLARLASSGEEILAASDDGTLWLVQRREGTRLFRDSLKLRGAVFTDLNSASPGLEVATAGYSGRVSLLHENAGEWTAETVIATEAALHHLTSGELDRAAGQELVTVGFAGDVVLLRRAR